VPAESRRYQGRTAEVQVVILAIRKVPVEIYEKYRHANAPKVLVPIINTVLVGYLIHLVRNKSSDLG
jgi:uncharacterized membrane protein (DUF2068 family)